MPSKAEMCVKVVKQQHAGRSITAGILLRSEMIAEAGTIGTSFISSAARPLELDSRKVSNSKVDKTAIFSRDTHNNSRNSQLEH
jgi:hypothetical protein